MYTGTAVDASQLLPADDVQDFDSAKMVQNLSGYHLEGFIRNYRSTKSSISTWPNMLNVYNFTSDFPLCILILVLWLLWPSELIVVMIFIIPLRKKWGNMTISSQIVIFHLPPFSSNRPAASPNLMLFVSNSWVKPKSGSSHIRDVQHQNDLDFEKLPPKDLSPPQQSTVVHQNCKIPPTGLKKIVTPWPLCKSREPIWRPITIMLDFRHHRWCICEDRTESYPMMLVGATLSLQRPYVSSQQHVENRSLKRPINPRYQVIEAFDCMMKSMTSWFESVEARFHDDLRSVARYSRRYTVPSIHQKVHEKFRPCYTRCVHRSSRECRPSKAVQP